MRNLGFIIMVGILLVMTGCAHVFSPPKHGPKKPPAATVEPTRPKHSAPAVTVIPPARPALPEAPVTVIAPSKPELPSRSPAEEAELADLIKGCTLLPAKPLEVSSGEAYYRRYAGNVGKTAVFRMFSMTDMNKCLAFEFESTAFSDTDALSTIYIQGQ